MLPEDEQGIFQLDSNPQVTKYLHMEQMTTVEEAQQVIQRVRQQYLDFGIGRWTVIEKDTGDFIGWCGLKWITDHESGKTDFHDVGYRLIPTAWGKGYATESTIAALQYAFTGMNLKEVIGMCHEENKASRRVLEKCGLKFIEQFSYKGLFNCDWLKITHEEYLNYSQL